MPLTASPRSHRQLLAAAITGALFTFGYVLLSGLLPPPSPLLGPNEVAVSGGLWVSAPYWTEEKATEAHDRGS
jgi:hypothetical protein